MQYIKLKRKAEEVDLFSEEEMGQSGAQPNSHDDYEKLIAYLEKKNVSAVLPIQIAYYAGLRIGEVCGLTWQDINLEEQYLTVKRSVRYDGAKYKMIQHHLNNILDFLPLKADMKILDLGTGSGYLSFPVAQKYPNVSRVMNLKKRLKLC